MTLIFNGSASDPASALIRGIGQTQPAARPVFVVGDTPTIDLYVGDGGGGYDSVSGSATVTPWLGIVTPGAEPTGGTFWLSVSTATSGTLTSGKRYQIQTFVAGDDFANVGAASNESGIIFTASDTTPTTWSNGSTVIEITTDLNYNATAAQVESALEATQAVGGVSVTKPGASALFVVTWDANGAVSAMSSGGDLSPGGAALVNVARDGSASETARQVIHLTLAPYVLQTTWTPYSSGWRATFNCNTDGLVRFLDGASSSTAYLELQLITVATGYARTVGQVQCIVRNDGIDESSTVPDPRPAYMTSAVSNLAFIQNRYYVDALTGGGNALDGIATGTTAAPDVSTGSLICIELSGNLSFYELVTGTDGTNTSATDGNIVVRPADFHSTLNARVWKKRGGITRKTSGGIKEDSGGLYVDVLTTDSRLSDARTPTAHETSHLPGGSDALPWTTAHGRGDTASKPASAAGNAGYLYFDTTLGKLQRSTGAAWEDCSETGTGDVFGPASAVDSSLAAFDTTTGKLLKDSAIPMSNVVVTGDSRLSDSRTPTAHASTHAPAGSDALPWTAAHGRGDTASKPAAAAGNAGYLYFDTTLGKLQRSTGAAWEDCESTVGSGDVVGPASAVDSQLAAFDTTTGKLIKDSGLPVANVVVTSDSRLSDSRTPTAHTHPLSELEQSGATTGQVPKWNGTAWAPADETGGSGGVWKQAVRFVTVADDSLSGLTARNGVTPVSGDRVGVIEQTTTTAGGIYVAASGAWSRASDCLTGDLVNGLAFVAIEGTVGAGQIHFLSIDTSNSPATHTYYRELLHRSSIASSVVTGVTETLVATVAVPPLGANAEVIFNAVFTRPTDQAANTMLKIKLDATLIAVHILDVATFTAIPVQHLFSNRNDSASQICGCNDSGVLITATINTLLASTLTFYITNTDAGDSTTLESLTVRQVGDLPNFPVASS